MAPTSVITSTRPYYPQRLRESYRLTVVQSEAAHDAHAEISFHPDWDQFQARVQRSMAQGLSDELPAGWPKHISGPMSWRSSELEDAAFTYHLTVAELGEIHQALHDFKAKSLQGDGVSRDTFRLPELAKKIKSLRDEVYHGVGCKTLRGLDVAKYSAEDLSIILCGVSSYVADRRGKQDQEGSMVKHIVDFHKAESKVDLPFHTDVVCDVVATLTRVCSEQGGNGTLAPGAAVYNRLAATRPDLIKILAEQNWPLDTYGRSPAFYSRALLYLVDGKPVFNFSRRILTGHPLNPRTAGIPGLTERQAEALDALHFAAKDCQTVVSMEPGDIRFVNNMGMLHGREAFSDAAVDAESLSKRHLIRLWLHNSGIVQHLPPALQLAWDRTFYDDQRSVRWDWEPPRDKNGKLFGIQLTACD